MTITKQKFINRKIKWSLVALGTLIILTLLGFISLLFGGRFIVNEDNFILPATTTVETANGEVIGELFEERRYPVMIEDIPEYVQEAFIAVEDRRFYQHKGVDPRSIVRAVYRDIIARGKVEGASTITQQLAKNLFLEHDKTWMRKTKEAMAALHLERKLTKDEILELYLNKIYFGDGLYGIEAASRYFFSKSVEDLTLNEGAILAGMIQAPNYYFPERHPERAKERRDVVLETMERAGFISAEEKIKEQGKTLGLNILDREQKPWLDSFLDLVIKEAEKEYQLPLDELRRGGYQIIVTVDEMIQQTAYEHFQKDEYFPGNTEGVEGAFVMIEQETGKVVSAIGGRNYSLGDLNRVTVKRQPGSVIKPLVIYGPALMENEYHPYVMLPDEAMAFDGHVVSNVDGKYEGYVSLYDALVHSKNAPTVWLLNEIGVEQGTSYLDKMNIKIEDDGWPVALGALSEGMTPLEIVKGFSNFENKGKSVEPFTIERIVDNDKVIAEREIKTYDIFDPQVSWYLTEMMQKVVTSGTGSRGEYAKALAGKTGTTEHPRVEGQVKDAWFAGYTPEYTMALWMGYDVSDEEHYLTGGSSYPTKLTKDILSSIDREIVLSDEFIKPEFVEGLPDPIHLQEVTSIDFSYTFGGFPFLKGRLTWESENDERVIYRIYEESNDGRELVDEVPGGQKEFVIDKVPF
ncbi:MAG TPA: PBP1A family penicillin-binding protein, partial [Bacillota bacterium]|nr:PBP1A family penicillin-binding protein [Bacillota bacterium]